jgi:hypothetical protein
VFFGAGNCTIYKDKLVTFDGTPIMLPAHQKHAAESRCDIMLARDCSYRSTFTVTGSYVRGHRTVKVITQSHVIELVPDSNHKIGVKVNNEEVTVSYSHPVKFSEVRGDSRSVQSHNILHHNLDY